MTSHSTRDVTQYKLRHAVQVTSHSTRDVTQYKLRHAVQVTSHSTKNVIKSLGGVETVLSLLQNERFLRGADKQTRRSCLHIFAKITKFVLTTLCYGTLALFKVYHFYGDSLILFDDVICLPARFEVVIRFTENRFGRIRTLLCRKITVIENRRS